ncbi:hypothetical protein [uncultured Maribacter sp.]|uniref:hypothetical protein n=1 Tax=uncultured Maribacter sp. TaxID=431308 RepID=UPI0026372B34|nr:hypothetical protein [uncultured Maribacter sp.]
MLLFAVYLWATDSGPLNQKVVLGILSIVVLGYSITFQIGKEFANYKHFQLFGLNFFKSRLSIPYPDYMIVFSPKFKQGAEWGSLAAIGKERREDSFVIRFFTGNKHFTVYRTSSLKKAKEKALELSCFFGHRD